MKTTKQTVSNLCDKIYTMGYSQITIDLVQDVIEEVLHSDETIRDDIGAAAYQCSILLEIFNPIFEDDIKLLSDLERALRDWQSDYEFVNKTLGLPPEA